MLPIYLDHHATTPCDPRVVEAMLPFFTENFGNPAALTNEHGRRAANALEDARIAIARFLGVQPNEIYFTSGATEANNIALRREGVVTTAIEHKSVPGARIIQPDRDGFIYSDAIPARTEIVSVQAANGEIGAIQDIDAIGAACRERGIMFHSDVTQAAGKIPLDLKNVDLASLSAHKFYGPKGIGALYVRRGVRVPPLMVGGGQEKRLRSGTVNVPGAVGMAAALRIRAEEMSAEGERLTGLRNALWGRLTAEIDGVTINGPRERRLPGNLNVSFAGTDAASLMIAMRHFSLSSGSACSSGERGPSPVLTAIGVPEDLAMASIRIGLGKDNTPEHVDMLVADFKRTVARLREMSAP